MTRSFLFVFPTAVLGGAERVMFNSITHLLREGHCVTAYVMSRGRKPGWEGVEALGDFTLIVKSHASEKRSVLSFFASIRRLSREREFDYVVSSHTHVNAALSFMRRWGVLKCGRLISRESTFIFERFFGLKRFVFWCFYRYFYGSQDLLIFQTDGMRRSLVGALGFSPVRQTKVLSNPVNLADINLMLRDPTVSQFAHPVNIIGCGRLVPIKGFDLLIKSFSRVEKDYPNVGLVLVGDGPQRQELTELVRSLGLEKKVTFLGYQENPHKWLAQADIGVISSVKEGFPNVLLEMMAVGTKALISTPCTDGLEYLPGIRVLQGFDPDMLASELRDVIELREDHSSLFRDYVATKRDISTFWGEIISLSR